ncbi:MAG: HNH endonuclease [Planctomycetes bacterium]|nr:HNH endonuclease [Planctomycetota bacterium]
MPFDSDVKARMFIRCARLCCLCLKQCGTNIEAAHIIDEHKGGSNEEENGIPVCFDCHQEIGAYDPKHPKGNKFTPKELRERRDRVYAEVERRPIFTQVLASATRAKGKGAKIVMPTADEVQWPSGEAIKLLERMLDNTSLQSAFAGKLKMLSDSDRAHVLDTLAEKSPQMPRAVEILLTIAGSKLITDEEANLLTERTIRHVTLYGTTYAKAAMLRHLRPPDFAEASREVRAALFEEVIETIRNDQWSEVNELVPALERHVTALPSSLCEEFVLAIMRQSRSGSFDGAPAAKRMLKALPDEVARTAIHAIDAKRLCEVRNQEVMKDFISKYRALARPEKLAMLDDYLSLSYRGFSQKYGPDEE